MEKKDNENGVFTITVPGYMKNLFPDSREIKISNIRDRLPYVLNNKHDNGPDFSWRQLRTDQYRCYNKKWLSEHDCAVILLGIPFPNAAYLLIGKEVRKIHNKFEHGDLANLDLNHDLDYMMGLCQLYSIFTEIKKMFVLSKKELSPRENPQFISPIKNEFEPLEFLARATTPLSGFFETNILYETKKFFEVAKEHNFPVPEETKLWYDEQPGSGNESQSNCSDKQSKEIKEPDTADYIDYSSKNNDELRPLILAWKNNEGLTRREIAMRLYGARINAGYLKLESAMKKVDRIVNNKTS